MYKRFNPTLYPINNASITFLRDSCLEKKESLLGFSCGKTDPLFPKPIEPPPKRPAVFNYDCTGSPMRPGPFYINCAGFPPKCKLSEL